MNGEGLAEGAALTAGARGLEEAQGTGEGSASKEATGGKKQLVPHGLHLLHSQTRKVIFSKRQERTWVWAE